MVEKNNTKKKDVANKKNDLGASGKDRVAMMVFHSDTKQRCSRWESLAWIVIGGILTIMMMGCLFLIFVVAGVISVPATARLVEVHVRERYIIESCSVTEIDGHRTVKVYTCSEVDGGRFLFFLTGVNEECASGFRATKVGKDFIMFETLLHLEKRASWKWGGMN